MYQTKKLTRKNVAFKIKKSKYELIVKTAKKNEIKIIKTREVIICLTISLDIVIISELLIRLPIVKPINNKVLKFTKSIK